MRLMNLTLWSCDLLFASQKAFTEKVTVHVSTLFYIRKLKKWKGLIFVKSENWD